MNEYHVFNDSTRLGSHKEIYGDFYQNGKIMKNNRDIYTLQKDDKLMIKIGNHLKFISVFSYSEIIDQIILLSEYYLGLKLHRTFENDNYKTAYFQINDEKGLDLYIKKEDSNRLYCEIATIYGKILHNFNEQINNLPNLRQFLKKVKRNL